MTIGERINLHRCGYTRAEIDALAAAEKEELQQAAQPEAEQEEAPEAQPETATPAALPETPNPNKEILDAINNLAAVIQSRNVNTQQQPQQPQQTVNDLINTL
jgi:hypothetical protein